MFRKIAELFGRLFNRHPLQNMQQAEVLAYYLIKEIMRHRKDIIKAKMDLEKLKRKYGVDIDEIKKQVKVDAWIAP